MTDKDSKFWIWFSRIEKLNILQKKQLLEKYKSIKKIWDLNETELNKVEGMTENIINEMLNNKYRCNLNEYEKYMDVNNINMINITNKQYPDKLRGIYDPPIILFAKGNMKLLEKKCVAVVGCRDCSEYGKNIAIELSYNLAKQGICIISGLARGIDKYAHIGALKAKGNTIAVIGNGIDNIYPYENRGLAEKILENNGLIISEYVIGTSPNKINFPARNRIISGLSDGVVVVEAKEKSGALITADFGLEQGKEVFAVPGSIYNNNSNGTNNLIKEGANVVIDYKDIIEAL